MLGGIIPLNTQEWQCCPESTSPLLCSPSLGLEHLVQDTHEGSKLQYSNSITKCIIQRAGHAVGNSAKDVRLGQGRQSSCSEHGPEVNPEGLWHEKDMGFSHRCEHQEALAPDLVPDFTLGDCGDLLFRAGAGRLPVIVEMEKSLVVLCKQPAHCHDSHM